MTATHVNIRFESNMPYFGVFNRMFVHFQLYTTNEAVYDSLCNLNFRNHCFTTYCKLWTCTKSVDSRHSMKRDKLPSVDVLPMFFHWTSLPISQSSLYGLPLHKSPK